MLFPPTVKEHGPITLAMVLMIVVLGIWDAFYTLELTSLGARELNPIMAFYLNQSPQAFFTVKYFLTCATLIILVSLKETTIFGMKIHRDILLMMVLILMGCVVRWEIYLLGFTLG